jgi:HlyD family secretion protein
MTSAADLLVTQLDNVITVPSSAIQTVNNATVVYTLAADGATAQRTQVTIGATSDIDSQILDGLIEGDLLILNPPSSTSSSSSTRGGGFGIPFMGGGGGGGPRD